jgi:hypothetical protein
LTLCTPNTTLGTWAAFPEKKSLLKINVDFIPVVCLNVLNYLFASNANYLLLLIYFCERRKTDKSQTRSPEMLQMIIPFALLKVLRREHNEEPGPGTTCKDINLIFLLSSIHTFQCLTLPISPYLHFQLTKKPVNGKNSLSISTSSLSLSKLSVVLATFTLLIHFRYKPLSLVYRISRCRSTIFFLSLLAFHDFFFSITALKSSFSQLYCSVYRNSRFLAFKRFTVTQSVSLSITNLQNTCPAPMLMF